MRSIGDSKVPSNELVLDLLEVPGFVEQMHSAPFDTAALSVIDFDTGKFSQSYYNCQSCSWFDLASLTKALGMGIYALGEFENPKIFDQHALLLLEHRSGLPAWGHLDHKRWRSHLLSFPIRSASTTYSDYGFLRLMLQLEKVLKRPIDKIFAKHLDQEVCYWLELSDRKSGLSFIDHGVSPLGVVHDPRARLLNRPCTHAGLFGTLSGVAKTLIKAWRERDLCSKIQKNWSRCQDQRFILGFDKVQNREMTLAGKGCSEKTIGHLGFTGTSFWIDLERKRAWVLLTNVTQKYWYQRKELNRLRRQIGAMVWN
jgi:hypothetical protein